MPMTQAWRDVHGHFIVATKRNGRVVAARRADTQAEADEYAAKYAATPGRETTVTFVPGTQRDLTWKDIRAS